MAADSNSFSPSAGNRGLSSSRGLPIEIVRARIGIPKVLEIHEDTVRAALARLGL